LDDSDDKEKMRETLVSRHPGNATMMVYTINAFLGLSFFIIQIHDCHYYSICWDRELKDYNQGLQGAICIGLSKDIHLG
jgi:hypothetical protein